MIKTKFYVNFGDNDFHRTTRAFVEVLATRIFFEDWGDITKEQIVELFNAHAYSLYCLHQADLGANPDETYREYLKIKVGKVYFDEEFDAIDPRMFNDEGCLAYINGNADLKLQIC